jgi:DNA-binding CsgD family transcriptional regulator
VEKRGSRLLLEIYCAASETPTGAFEDQVLNLIKPLLGFERSTWGTGALTPIGLDIHNVHLLHDDPEEMLLNYEEVKHQDDVVMKYFKFRGNTAIVYSPSLYQGRKKLGMLSLAKRFEHQNMLVTTNRGEGNHCQWISLYRASEQQYTEEERQLCEFLVPHLMEALTINRVVHLDSVGMENRRYARGFSDRKGLLQFVEPNLTNLFQSEWSSWNDSLLPTPLLEAFVTANGTRFRGRHIVVHAVRQKGLLFLGARKRCAADELSERELQVAKHIAAGLSHKEIARLINIAPATARNHTQTIYGKLQVSNKAKLIAELGLIGEV